MEIVNTFVDNLYSFKYDDEEFDELERLLDEWNDPLFLEDFFESNKADLAYFHVSVDTAIKETKAEAKAWQKFLLTLYQKPEKDLNSLFQVLSNASYREVILSSQKSKRRWLRIYALKIDENVYVITGGAIKLTKTMQERLHTQKELDKLNRCRDFLRAHDVFDADSFFEIQNTSQ